MQLLVAHPEQVQPHAIPDGPGKPLKRALQLAVDAALAHRVGKARVVLAQEVREPAALGLRQAHVVASEHGQQVGHVHLGVQRPVFVMRGEEQHELVVHVVGDGRGRIGGRAVADDDRTGEARVRAVDFVNVVVVEPHNRRAVLGTGARRLRHTPHVFVRGARGEAVVELVCAVRLVIVRRALGPLLVLDAVRVEGDREGQVVARDDTDGVANGGTQRGAEQPLPRRLGEARCEVCVSVAHIARLDERGAHTVHAVARECAPQKGRHLRGLRRERAAARAPVDARGRVRRVVVGPVGGLGGHVVDAGRAGEARASGRRRRTVRLDLIEREHAGLLMVVDVVAQLPDAGVLRHHVGRGRRRGEHLELVAALAAVEQRVAVPVRGVDRVLAAHTPRVPAHALPRTHREARLRAVQVAVDRVHRIRLTKGKVINVDRLLPLLLEHGKCAAVPAILRIIPPGVEIRSLCKPHVDVVAVHHAHVRVRRIRGLDESVGVGEADLVQMLRGGVVERLERRGLGGGPERYVARWAGLVEDGSDEMLPNIGAEVRRLVLVLHIHKHDKLAVDVGRPAGSVGVALARDDQRPHQPRIRVGAEPVIPAFADGHRVPAHVRRVEVHHRAPVCRPGPRGLVHEEGVRA